MAKRDIPETNPQKLRDMYPNNSQTVSEKTVEVDVSKKTKQVAKGKVRKQGLLKRFARYIIEDTIESARERTFSDIVIPGVKTLIFDTATEVLDLMLFGGSSNISKGSKRRSDSRRSTQTSYSKYYEAKNNRSSDRSYRSVTVEPDDIILDTRREAMDVLNELDEMIHQYGQASIADFYDIVGVTAEWTDNKYGWTSLRDAGVRPVRDGFLIILPRTRVLDD